MYPSALKNEPSLQRVFVVVIIKQRIDIDRELVALGYQCLHRSSDAGNYLRGDERVDFIYASRPAARRLLEHAATIQTAFGEVRVVSTEGLIGLNAYSSDRERVFHVIVNSHVIFAAGVGVLR
jgi:hypothetical protein